LLCCVAFHVVLHVGQHLEVRYRLVHHLELKFRLVEFLKVIYERCFLVLLCLGLDFIQLGERFIQLGARRREFSVSRLVDLGQLLLTHMYSVAGRLEPRLTLAIGHDLVVCVLRI